MRQRYVQLFFFLFLFGTVMLILGRPYVKKEEILLLDAFSTRGISTWFTTEGYGLLVIGKSYGGTVLYGLDWSFQRLIRIFITNGMGNYGYRLHNPDTMFTYRLLTIVLGFQTLPCQTNHKI
jgi:hypothetical protein